MNKLMKKAVVTVMSAALTVSLLPAVPAQAAKKKLSVNKVYNTTTKVKGKTKGKYAVKIKIGKRTYKATASKKGNYSIKIPKQSAGKTLCVRAYKKGGKKYYTKKKFYVLAKTVSVKKFSKSSKYIKGYARPRYTVKVTINGKTYKKKASKTKGFFSIKMKKAAGNATATIKIYNTKGKYVNSYKKKAYNAASPNETFNKIRVNINIPGKDGAIDMEQVKKHIKMAEKAGKPVVGPTESDGNTFKNGYFYYIDSKDYISVGYIMNYLYTEADGAHAQFRAKDGITLYFTLSPKRWEQFNWPTKEQYDLKLESGQNRKFQGTEFKELPHNNLFYKVKGYKNGKLVIMEASSQYLIAGYNDSMFQ